jgi:hypothetical protein
MELPQAAIAWEHLCKAYLCSLHPALLAELKNGSLDSLLHLVGLASKSQVLSPRTISARTADQRVRTLLQIRTPKRLIDDLVDVRDGAMHAGLLPSAYQREVFIAFLRASNEVHDALENGDRWGEYNQFVEQVIGEQVTEIEHEVRKKLEAARRSYANVVETVPEDELPTVMAVKQGQTAHFLYGSEHQVNMKCPICGDEEAQCAGSVDLEWEPDFDVEGGETYITGAYPIAEFYSRGFSCGVCGLRLSTPQELGVAGLPLNLQLPDDEAALYAESLKDDEE